MVEHVVHTVAGEGTTRDTIDIVLCVGLLSCLDYSDPGEGTFTEEVLALELVSEARRRDLSTKPWRFPSVAEVGTFDRRVVCGIDGEVTPDLIPEPSTVEGEDIELLAVDFSDEDGEVLCLCISQLVISVIS